MKKNIRNKKTIIFVISAILCCCFIVVFIFGIKYFKEQKQKYIEECYCKQNNAFLLQEYGDYYHYFDEATEYREYSNCRTVPYLYSWIQCYNHEKNSKLTLEDVQEYLSKEYEENGERRIYTDYKEIADYIDYIHRCQMGKDKSLKDFVHGINDCLDIILETYPVEEYNLATLPLGAMDEMIKRVYDPSYEMQLDGLTPVDY